MQNSLLSTKHDFTTSSSENPLALRNPLRRCVEASIIAVTRGLSLYYFHDSINLIDGLLSNKSSTIIQVVSGCFLQVGVTLAEKKGGLLREIGIF